MYVPSSRQIYSATKHDFSRLTVCISLYRYQEFITEALNSVHEQDIEHLDLVVVEDRSPDASLNIALDWLKSFGRRFGRCVLIQHDVNAGLPGARNTGFLNAKTPYVFVLDADNQLYPRCVRRCYEIAEENQCEAVFPIIECFGETRGLQSTDLWNAEKFKKGNYIDAMALISRDAWVRVDGYSRMLKGWEDYDLWLKFVEKGFKGVHVPEVLARYRVHAQSMLRTVTNIEHNLKDLKADLKSRHPWVSF